jgi:oxygen-dependent protoporphyrinogen oxidase
VGPKKVDAVIVGAGISGLCVAYWLNRAGVDVVVLEKDSEVGGTMKTKTEDGYLVEIGPNSALETTPLFQDLFSGLKLHNELAYANPVGKNRFILRDGTLHALPLNPFSFLRTKLFSASAKVRLFREPWIGRAESEETISEFVTRRLGREFLDYAIDPFVAGVYAADPAFLSVRAAFPKLYRLEERYGSLILGAIKGRKERKERAEKAKDRAPSFSFVHGMNVLPASIARELGDRVLLDARTTRIRDLRLIDAEPLDEPGARTFKVEFLHQGTSRELECDAVVLSCPAFSAAPLIQAFSIQTAHALESIEYAPVTSVFLGFRRQDIPHALNGFGFLVPRIERRNILGCLWSSSLFPGRAPEGSAGLTVFVGGSRQPELAHLSDGETVSRIREELQSIMQIEGKPVYWNISRWERAIPQYGIGHVQLQEGLEEFEEKHSGLFFCSNYKGGIAVGDCVANARSTADRVREFLGSLKD